MKVDNITLHTETKLLKDEYEELKAQFDSFMLKIYPIGCIYMSIQNISPNTLFGGTWERWGVSRFPLGVDESNSNYSEAEMIGGETTHTLTIAEMPAHNHEIGNYSLAGKEMLRIDSLGNTYSFPNNVGDIDVGERGLGQPHNNMPPYITCYMWKRVS